MLSAKRYDSWHTIRKSYKVVSTHKYEGSVVRCGQALFIAMLLSVCCTCMWNRCMEKVRPHGAS